MIPMLFSNHVSYLAADVFTDSPPTQQVSGRWCFIPEAASHH
jgi:hypothetical protein